MEQVLHGEVGAMFCKQKGRLTRAVKHLAQDLYAQQAHLLLELLQNADDNSYAACEDSANAPALRLDIFPSALVLQNNETGFLEKDVRSICDIGNSSKKHKANLTGEKGIGKASNRVCVRG